MHRSRLAGFVIDCQGSDPRGAATFWSAALGLDSQGLDPLGADGDNYVRLDAAARDLVVEVQSVSHPSRVHLDIEADDVEAEVKRLEQLGARRVEQIRTWWVMEAPTGQRFCVVRAKSDLSTRPGGRVWK
jgi:Glyoxalase-like domain